MSDIEITILQHKKTGLLMAMSRDVPGFIVHAHTDDEMQDKLVPAYYAYMEALGEPLDGEYELIDKSAPGFWPPVFVIHSARQRAA
jgi:hypothetical protein